MEHTRTEPPATRAEGLRRLEAFVANAGRAYAATRNEDRGPDDRNNVSTLSPYVRHRLVTEEDVLRAVLARHSRTSAFKFVQEVFWRTYWKGWLESRPLVWSDYRAALDVRISAANADDELRGRLDAAYEGRTGIDAFDAWSRELVETNYLHNHARMWFASVWIFTLRLPWELGADLFMRHLLCGDPASNTLSWRWVAGLQTRGKTYLARPSNIARYTLGRFPATSGLATEAPPLPGPSYEPQPLPALTTELSARAPALLVLHDDDLGVDSLAIDSRDIRVTMAFEATARRSPSGVAPNVARFTGAALRDALDRSPGQTILLDGAADVEQSARRIGDIAREHRVSRVIAPYAPVGPTSEVLEPLRDALTARGLEVVTLARRYDALSWPHANRGFFGLGKAIPSVLDRLDVGPVERDLPCS